MKLDLRLGDCVAVMAAMPEASIDEIVCDPPYLFSLMNRTWDKEDKDFHHRWLVQAFRVLVPGGRVKAFSATRTYHRLAKAMVTVGFQIITLEAHGYSSGFPKSHNTSMAVDRHFGKLKDRPVIGTKRGVGGENMNDIVADRTTIRTTEDAGGKGVGAYGVGAKQKSIEIPITGPATPEAALWDGWGTALKPAFEPILVGMKPR